MDAALLIAVAAYTAAVVLTCRNRWAHRCAECSYRGTTRTTGRHRPDRVVLPVRTTRTALPAGGPGTPTRPARPRPGPRALPAGSGRR